MHRIGQFLILLLALMLVACPSPTSAPKPKAPPVVVVDDLDKEAKGGKVKGTPLVKANFPANGDGVEDREVTPTLPELSRAEQHEAALLKAVDIIADSKYEDALKALYEAQKFNDSGPVQRQIDKVKAIIATREAAEKAVADVKTVLEDGRPEEAAKLAQTALSNYGGGEQADELTKLAQQADAVVSATVDDTDARLAKLKADADAAIKASNLRAGAVALEQAISIRPDDTLETQLNDVRDKIRTYDDNRRTGLALRKEPGRVDEALTRFKAAQTAWDTVQVQQEIDQCTLILERRRDRLSVADFEVRGDVGLATAGREVGEELLGHFKPRFDLVERGQINKVLEELEMQPGELGENVSGRREFARLAKVRYLVVGSLSPLGGVTCHARLVEVGTGLIVQTARVSAPNLEALMPRLKVLATLLQMTDEQKAAFEAEQEKKFVVIKPIDPAPLVDLPPPPPPPPAIIKPADLPPPIITYNPAPVPLAPPGKVLAITEFRTIAEAPIVVVPPPPPQPLAVVIPVEDPRRHRMFRLSLELGDNLLRRGHYREAHRHFSLALSISGPRRDLAIRIDTCRPFLPPPPPPIFFAPPPPPPVVVLPPPVFIAPPPVIIAPPPRPPVVIVRPPLIRPRVAVFGFQIFCQPGLVPSRASELLADQFASYCGGNFDVIDRGEVCWFMGRLGLTMQDVLNDPVSRRCLAQALNARFFVFGTVQETGSFDVHTHLVDTESGAKTGTGKIHVKDHEEIKLRIGELAKQIGATPAEQKEMAKKGADSEAALNAARTALRAKDPATALTSLDAALKENPGNSALQSLRAEAQRQQRQSALEAERKAFDVDMAKRLAEVKKREDALARETALARARAEEDAKTRGEAERKRLLTERERAATSLQAQAKAASARGDYPKAVQLLTSASTLKASDEIFKDLATARLAANNATRERAEAEAKKRAEAEAKSRETALARVKAEQESRNKLDLERKKAQEARDQAMYDGFFKAAKDAFEKKDYAKAVSAAESARRFKNTEENTKILRDAQSAASLAKATAAEKVKLEKEIKEREAKEAQLQKDRTDYLKAMEEGQKAIVAKNYPDAEKFYAAAFKLFPTDPARSGLAAAKEYAKRESEAAVAMKKAKEEESKRAERLKALVADGDKAFGAKDYVKAADFYRQARTLSPEDVNIGASLARAQRERDAVIEANRREAEAKARATMIAAKLKTSKDALAKKDFKGALTAAQGALDLDPTNVDGRSLRAQAEVGMKAGTLDPKEKQKLEDYKLAMETARGARKAGKIPEAINSYKGALAIMPEDRIAKLEMDELVKFQSETAFRALMLKAQTALKDKKPAEAVAAYDEALKMKPGDAKIINDRKIAQSMIGKGKAMEDYTAAMTKARAAVKAGEYSKALAAFDEILKAYPMDKVATTERAEVVKLQLEAAFTGHISAAREALKAKKFAEALKEYDLALKLKPKDNATIKARQEVVALENKSKTMEALDGVLLKARAAAKGGKYAEALTLLDEALKTSPMDKALLNERSEVVKLKTEADFQAWILAAQEHLKAKKYAEAIKAYDSALKLKPEDAKTLSDRKIAVEMDKKAKMPLEDPKKKIYDTAIAKARAAAKDKKYNEAIKAFDEALEAMPKDKLATNERAETVKLAIDAAYTAYMTQAGAALKAKRYPEAIKAYDEALKMKPGDKLAIDGKREAVEADKKSKMPAEDPKKKAFDAAMLKARDLVIKKDFAGGLLAFDEALKLMPGDKTATTARAEAIKLRTEAFSIHMKAGNDAMKIRKFADAVKHYDDALKVIPGDPDAIKAKKAATDAGMKPEVDPKMKEKLADYKLAMDAAQAALKNKNYAGAANAYREALRVMPGDKAAQSGFEAASKLMKEMEKPKEPVKPKEKDKPTEPAKPKDDRAKYTALIKAAIELDKQKKHEDALKTYQAALKEVPGDFSSNAALKVAQRVAYTGIARNEHALKHYADAVKAYEEVLKRDPDNKEAKDGLARAKANKP